jgi:hypothetical protein
MCAFTRRTNLPPMSNSGLGSEEPSRTRGGGLMSGLAAVCWAIWTTWNRVCFDKIQIKNSYELIFSACLSMCYWARLHATKDQAII